jgi:tetratricopeptide (TPR) repeat protein
MSKSDKGAVLRTALFFLLLAPAILFSCRNSTKTIRDQDGQATTAAVNDTSSLLALDKLIRDNPKNPALFARRAKLYADKKNWSQALSDVTIALRMDSLNPAYYISQAEYYIFNGEPNSAKKGLDLCLKKFPGNTDVMLKLAEIHLYLKEYGQAKMVLRDVIPINDDIAQIYFIQGLIALETKDTTGAIRNFQVAIDKDPEFYAAYIQAGKIFSVQNNPLAMQYLKSAVDLQPNMYEAHYLLGMYYQEHNMLDEAHQEYEFISTRIDSTQADPYFNRGYIEMVYRGNYPEAEKWFSKAIYWNPNYADAWYNRGFTYELDGKLSKAKEDYRKAIEIEPNFPLAIKGLNRIDDGKPLKNK